MADFVSAVRIEVSRICRPWPEPCCGAFGMFFVPSTCTSFLVIELWSYARLLTSKQLKFDGLSIAYYIATKLAPPLGESPLLGNGYGVLATSWASALRSNAIVGQVSLLNNLEVEEATMCAYPTISLSGESTHWV